MRPPLAAGTVPAWIAPDKAALYIAPQQAPAGFCGEVGRVAAPRRHLFCQPALPVGMAGPVISNCLDDSCYHLDALRDCMGHH